MGAFFEGGQGYRQDRTTGVATGETPQTMYVTRANHRSAASHRCIVWALSLQVHGHARRPRQRRVLLRLRRSIAASHSIA